MKKIQGLFRAFLTSHWVLFVAFFALTAQIGYRYVRGDGTAASVTCWDSTYIVRDCTAGEISAVGFPLTTDTIVAGDDDQILFGDDSDGIIEYISGTDIFSITHPTGSLTVSALVNLSLVGSSVVGLTSDTTDILISPTPTAGASGTVISLDTTLLAMNGSDTVNFFDLLPENTANHTGTGNTLNLLNIAAIAGDANSNLTAINIGALTGTAGAAGEVEAAISFGTGWDFELRNSGGALDYDSSSIHIFYAAGAELLRITNANAITTGTVPIGRQPTAAGSTAQFGTYNSAPGAANGSDNYAGFRLNAFTDANHTGTGNFWSGVDAEAITTPDAQIIHAALRVGTGWDAILMAQVKTAAWSAAENPPTNEVAFFLDESGANCNFTARLSDGTEVVLGVLVVAGDCP